jgi:hypothetical protein
MSAKKAQITQVQVCILELIILPKITRPDFFISDKFPNFHKNDLQFKKRIIIFW